MTLVSYSSTITMMHGTIYIKNTIVFDWKYIFIVVFQFYNTTGCPFQKKKKTNWSHVFPCGRTGRSKQQLCATWRMHLTRTPKKIIFRRNKLFSEISTSVAFNCFRNVSCTRRLEYVWYFNIQGQIHRQVDVWMPDHDPSDRRDERYSMALKPRHFQS